MRSYYVITGSDNGMPIEAYVINDYEHDVDAHLYVGYSDASRRYVRFDTLKEAEAYAKQVNR
jgi:hypothetical protein